MVHGWAKKSVKKFPSLAPTAIDPPNIFSQEMLVAERVFDKSSLSIII